MPSSSFRSTFRAILRLLGRCVFMLALYHGSAFRPSRSTSEQDGIRDRVIFRITTAITPSRPKIFRCQNARLRDWPHRLVRWFLFIMRPANCPSFYRRAMSPATELILILKLLPYEILIQPHRGHSTAALAFSVLSTRSISFNIMGKPGVVIPWPYPSNSSRRQALCPMSFITRASNAFSS